MFKMERSRILQFPADLKPYELRGLNQQHVPVTSKKWWLGFCCAVLGVLLLLYVPVYHQLQTRIGETIPGDLVVGIAGWNYNTSRDMRQYILPDNTTSVQQPSHLCLTPLFLLIIVCSAVENVDSRNAIRQSWGSESLVSNATVKTKLYAENQQYDDIIQERFIDSYNNLTLKSVMMLKWVNNHCLTSVNFVMKTDDDMFVNVAALVKLLKARVKPAGLLIGSLICGARPVADTKSKWYAPKYMYADRVYPNYLSGTGYVMSSDTVARLYKSALSTPLFHLEDVYITGMCSRRARIKPQNNPTFSYEKRKFDQCVYKNIVTSHRVTPREMHKMFYLLHQPDLVDLCKDQVTSTPRTSPTGTARDKKKLVRKRNMCH
ncbi:uncharacterized protein CBL_08511 [Carabus blaptoides fortunei]